MPHIKELLENRAGLMEGMQTLLHTAEEAHRDLTAVEAARFDRLDKQCDRLEIEINAQQARDDIERDLDLTPGFPPPGALHAGVPRYQPRSSNWMDTRTGKEIRTLRPSDSFASVTGGKPRFNLGEFARAAALGTNDAELRAALSEGSGAAGQFTVPQPLAGTFIDVLRAKTVTIRAGATTVPMDSQTLSIARLASDPVAHYHAENTADMGDENVAFERVLFTAKSAGAIVQASRELVEDSANLNDILTRSFAAAFALAIDKAALGYGGSGSPTGLADLAITTLDPLAAALSNYDPLVKLVGALKADNASDPTAFVMAPRSWQQLALLKTGISGDKTTLAPPPAIAGIPMLDTSSVSITEDSGSPVTNDNSTIFCGFFPDLLLGIRTQFSLTVLKERYMDAGTFGFFGWLRFDVQVAHLKSFAMQQGIRA